MNYSNSGLRRALSAEYVVGTLVGAARQRFQHLLSVDVELRREVAFWELHLSSINPPLVPVRPRIEVWQAIERSIQSGLSAAASSPGPQPQASLPTPRRWLPAWATLATAASVALAGVLAWQRLNPPPAPIVAEAPTAYVALLKIPDAPRQFTFSLLSDRGVMKVAASGDYPGLGAHSLQLWWISSGGPVSLGVLPTSGEGHLSLPPSMPRGGNLTLAISLEPVGGSPTGQPTGPVLTSGATVQAG